MSLATCEIYRTETGSIYELADGQVRRAGGDGTGPLDTWQPYRVVNRVPLALLRPGSDGEILEIVLANGRRVFTSRIVSLV